MHKQIRHAAGTIAFAALLGTATAHAGTANCDNCSAEEVEFTVYSALENNPVPSSDILYVVDVPGGTARKFQLERMYDNGGDPGWCSQPMDEVPLECVPFSYFDELPVEPQVGTYVYYMQAFQQQQTVYLPGVGDVPYNGYEAVQYPNKSDNVGTYLKNNGPGLGQAVLDFFETFTVIPYFNAGALKLTYRVNFADGGSALYTWNQDLKKFERVKGQTYDASGNVVPETTSDVSGGVGSTIEYDFTNDGESLMEFIIRMEMLGVPITGPMGNRLVCSGRDEGGRVVVTCVFR